MTIKHHHLLDAGFMLGRMSRLACLTSRSPCASQFFRDKETKTLRGWLFPAPLSWAQKRKRSSGGRRGRKVTEAKGKHLPIDKWRHFSNRCSKNKCLKYPLSRSKPPPPSRVAGRQEASLGYKQILSESSKNKLVYVKLWSGKLWGGHP